MSLSTASILSLSLEILLLILEDVEKESPATIRSLALVNKYLYSVCKPFNYRRTELYFGDEAPVYADPAFRSLLRDREALSGIRHLTIKGPSYLPVYFSERQQPLNEYMRQDLIRFIDSVWKWCGLLSLIKKMRCLKTLTWELLGPIPTLVIEALEQYQPRAELEVCNWQRACMDDDHDLPHEIALAKSHSLTSIDVELASSRDRGFLRASINRILFCAPNLTRVSISKSRMFESWGLYSVSGRAMPFYTIVDKKCTQKAPKLPLLELKADIQLVNCGSLKEWSKYTDFSRLESLHCTGETFSPRGSADILETFSADASQLFPNLRHFIFEVSENNYYTIETRIQPFLSTCRPLSELVLWNWSEVLALSTVLEKHGATMRKLHLHIQEPCKYCNWDAEERPRRTLTTKEIRKIKEKCPNIRDFSLDLNRRSSHLHAPSYCPILRAIADMPLHRLQVWLDFGILYLQQRQFYHPLKKEPVEPSTSVQIEEFARETWKMIFGNRGFGPYILDIRSGERICNYPGNQSHWTDEKSILRSLWQVRPEHKESRLGRYKIRKTSF